MSDLKLDFRQTQQRYIDSLAEVSHSSLRDAEIRLDSARAKVAWIRAALAYAEECELDARWFDKTMLLAADTEVERLEKVVAETGRRDGLREWEMLIGVRR